MSEIKTMNFIKELNIREVYEEYTGMVNMSLEELQQLSKEEVYKSNMALNRNIELLSTDVASWKQKHARWAKLSISVISRSPKDSQLKEWGFDNSKVNLSLKRGKNKEFIEMVDNISVVAKFSGGSVELPLPVRGELLRPGTYKIGKVILSELRKAFEILNNKLKSGGKILLFKTHNAYWTDNSNSDDLAGEITGVTWNTVNNAIDYVGSVLDPNTANQIFSKLISGISPGFTYENSGDGIARDMLFEECTITFRPHAEHSTIGI